MKDEHIKILAGVFLAGVVIYLISKSGKGDAAKVATQITDAVTTATKPLLEAVKGVTDAAATAVAGTA